VIIVAFQLEGKTSLIDISTGFYILGLIGQTEEGSLALEEFGWVSVIHAKRFCFPTDLNVFLQVRLLIVAQDKECT